MNPRESPLKSLGGADHVNYKAIGWSKLKTNGFVMGNPKPAGVGGLTRYEMGIEVKGVMCNADLGSIVFYRGLYIGLA